MKYNLSERQWRLLWETKHGEWRHPDYDFDSTEDYDNSLSFELNSRMVIFNSIYKSKFKLSYNEYDSDMHLVIDDQGHPDYWGYIEGDEKNITIFLLSL